MMEMGSLTEVIPGEPCSDAFDSKVTARWQILARAAARGASVSCALLLILALLLNAGAAFAAGKHNDKLPARYREWLEKEVVYIITKEEKDTFLKLADDERRNKFIERFWEIRNPTPGAPTNPYREEHYKRLQYASTYFGKEAGTDGWRTDRGRVYITLGPPQQRAHYLGLANMRPMEIWFYSYSHPALPPFFYVAFYQRENIGDFRLYSPYSDGPERLITTMRGQNDRIGSLKIVEQAAGREVARISLSLIPDEPVDLTNATSSLQSDVVLSAIRNLANHPLTKVDLERRRALLESVTIRLIVGGEVLKTLAVPLRGTDGNINLHYVLRLSKPGDFALSESKPNEYYYSVNATVRVFGPEDKLIFTQEKTLSHYLDKSQFETVKNKVFGYEGWLPLPPGKYKLEFSLTDLLKHTAFRAERRVVVPDVPTEGMRLTEVVPFSEAESGDPARSNFLPFSVAGVKFTPLLTHELDLPLGLNLDVFYQVWVPPRDPQKDQGRKLEVEYAYGRPGGRGEAKVIREDVQKEQFDKWGSLISGKRIPLAEMPTGSYMLTATLSDPETQQKAYGTLGFHITPNPTLLPAWDIYDKEAGEDVRNGLVDYQRGLCYLAFGQKERAMEWFQRALQKNPANEEARAMLVDLYFAREQFAKVADLFARAEITRKTSEQTILRAAESFEKIGDRKRAISLLESAVATKTDEGLLYLALASYYERAGEPKKAEELQRKGKSLMVPETSRP